MSVDTFPQAGSGLPSPATPHTGVLLPEGFLADLAPTILRQRLVIEGVVESTIDADEIVSYLQELSRVTDMVPLMTPVTHRSDLYGWAGWIHWETSGAHFYAWEQPKRFFSIDMYTCKAFDPQDAVAFTKEFFSPIEVTWFGF